MLEQQTFVMVKTGTVWFGINKIFMQIYLLPGCKQLISFCFGVIAQSHSQTPCILGMSLILSMAWVQSYIGMSA